MYNDKQKKILLEQLKKTPIVQVACQKLNVSRATFYRWRKEDAAFASAADEALLEGALLVNDLAESQLLSAIQARDMRAIVFWLKHHHQAYGTKIELSGRITSDQPLTPEQERVIREALRLASNNDADQSRPTDA